MGSTLFNDEIKEKPAANELVLTINKNRNQLSKAQQTFNRLTKKIKNLRLEIEKDVKALDEGLVVYAKEIHPLDKELVLIQKEMVRILFKFYTTHKAVSNNNRKILKQIIVNHLDEILSVDGGEPEADLKEIFRIVNGKTFESAVKDDFEDMKGEMEDFISRMGFHVNLKDLDMDMPEEKMNEKFREMGNDVRKQMMEEHQLKKAKKKTARQLQKEEKEKKEEEIRKRSISIIYKQLAKVLHPDLEQDENRKEEKHKFMQELTVAYEANDLATLLRLELQWIHGENSNLDTLSEEKLKIYNEALKQQVQQLEFEKMTLIEHPRYHAFERICFGFPPQNINYFLRGLKQEIRDDIEGLKKSLEFLNSDLWKDELTEIIGDFKAKQEEEEFDFPFPFIFSGK